MKLLQISGHEKFRNNMLLKLYLYVLRIPALKEARAASTFYIKGVLHNMNPHSPLIGATSKAFQRRNFILFCFFFNRVSLRLGAWGVFPVAHKYKFCSAGSVSGSDAMEQAVP